MSALGMRKAVGSDSPSNQPDSRDTMGEYLYRISHDLRAPLRRIRLLSGFLQEDHGATLPLDVAAGIGRIAVEAERANLMIEGLGVIVRINEAQLRKEPVELRPLIEACAISVQEAHGIAPIALEFVDNPSVEADPAQMQRLFTELLDNAVRYGDGDRIRIRISCSMVSEPCIRVEDGGRGIPTEQARIEAMAPFVRLDPEDAHNLRPGLGLAIAKAIAARNGGHLWLEASEGGGTCACIGLPQLATGISSMVAPRQSSMPPAGAVGTHDGASLRPPPLPFLSSVPPRAERVRILLVEDSEVDFHLVAHMLSTASGEYQVDWVRTADAGLNAIAQNRHDLLIVDYFLGRSTGVELLERASEQGWFGTAILMTGGESEALAMAAVRAGFSDFLCKSELSSTRLERTIKYCLERHRRAVELASVAYIDGLTSLLNVRGLDVSAKPMLRRASRTHTPLAVLAIDLDGFKLINDTHGHAAGNVVLKEVARRLRTRLRGSDLVARTGGDEFVVVLSEVTGPAAIDQIVSDLVDALETPIASPSAMLRVGASVGQALFPEAGTTLADLIASADAAMYERKRQRKEPITR